MSAILQDQGECLRWLQKNGVRIWERTYACGKSDQETMDVVTSGGIESGEQNDIAWIFLWAARWLDGACRMLESPPTYFAAMSATSTTPEAAEELRVPWPAFAVKLDEELFDGLYLALVGQFVLKSMDGVMETLLEYQKTGKPPTDEDFEKLPNTLTTILITLGNRDGKSVCGIMHREGSIADLVFGDSDNQYTGKKADPAIACIARGIGGLLWTMQHTTNWRAKSIRELSRVKGELRTSPPPHRTVLIGKPLKLDVREAIRSEARGEGTAPSVQTLVRGHLKRQVFGAGRSLRKVIWIEPYWKGPEKAPILSRPYVVGEKKSKRRPR